MNLLQRLFSLLRESWVLVGIAIAIFGAVELACRTLDAIRPPQELIEGSTRESLLRKEWGSQILRDSEANPYKAQYRTFVGFRFRPFKSATINIDADGIRDTPQPAAGGGEVRRLYALGGSTMFGTGVPDWGTLPAYLAKKSGEQGTPYRVVNYGNGWWNSSQSLEQLLVALRQENKPDVAVFLDGINEVDTISEGGSPEGIAVLAESRLERAFDEPTAAKSAKSFAQSLRLTQRLRRLRGFRSRGPQVSDGPSEAELAPLAERAVKVYENNVRAATALGREWGIKTYFFFQPFGPISRKKPAGVEGKLFEERKAKAWEMRLFEKVYDGVGRSSYLKGNPDFKNLADIFDKDEREVYLDSEHLFPEGNEALAAAMLDFIRSRSKR